MTIFADNYVIRNFREGDAKLYYKVAHECDVKKYVINAFPKNKKEAISIVKWYSENINDKDFYLVIQDINKKAIVGAIIATQNNSGILEVAAFVGKDYRRRGIMTTCLKAFSKWVKNEHPEIKQLHFTVEKDNDASNNQIQKFGAKRKKSKNSLYKCYYIKL